jgi:hypothetical protein
MGRIRAAAAVAAGTAAVWLASPGVAVAQLPACDPARAPLVYFSGLPDQLVTGRNHVFRVLEDDAVPAFLNSDVQLTMNENGVPFWSGTVGEFELEDSRLFIRSDPGDSALTVTASYAEYRLDTMYPAPAECQRVLAKTMAPTAGLPQP